MIARISRLFYLVLVVSVPLTADAMESGKSGPCKQETVAVEQVKKAPGAPSALRLALVPSGVRLEWTLSPQDPGVVTGYEIARSKVISGPYEIVGTVEKGVREFTDTSALPEHIYFYKVRAIAGSQHSGYSNEAVAEIPGKPGM